MIAPTRSIWLILVSLNNTTILTCMSTYPSAMTFPSPALLHSHPSTVIWVVSWADMMTSSHSHMSLFTFFGDPFCGWASTVWTESSSSSRGPPWIAYVLGYWMVSDSFLNTRVCLHSLKGQTMPYFNHTFKTSVQHYLMPMTLLLTGTAIIRLPPPQL